MTAPPIDRTRSTPIRAVPTSAVPTSAVPTSAARSASVVAVPSGRRVTLVPALLVVGALAAAAGVLAAAPAFGAPAAAADVDLARLLRAMAAIKGALVTAGAGVLAWRLRRPAPMALVLTYLAGVWVASAATAAMWSLVALGPVAIALHAAGAVLVVVAWRDAGFFPSVPNEM